MDRDGDNYNDEYYVPIQTISGSRIIKPNRFGKAAAIVIGLLTCQWNSSQQTSRPGSIKNIINKLANVSIFKATVYHTDLKSRNYDDIYINFLDPIIIAAETSQRDNLHLGKAMTVDYLDYLMKKWNNKSNIWPQKIIGKHFQNHHFQLQQI